MILKTLSAKALLGAGIFTVGAGSVAAVGLPMANAAAATPQPADPDHGPQGQPRRPRRHGHQRFRQARLDGG